MSDDLFREVPFIVVWVMHPDPEVGTVHQVFAEPRPDLEASDEAFDALFDQLVADLIESDEHIRGYVPVIRVFKVALWQAATVVTQYQDPMDRAKIAENVHWPPVRCSCLLCDGKDAATVHALHQNTSVEA